ncbi:MAG: hypothetical protein AAF978_02825 [Cyanobacteria bacterium P01_E01_bin.48]
MSKKKKEAKESNYIRTFRSKVSPAVAANVYRGTTSDGHTYLYYEISRYWSSGQREGYSSRFYSRNADGLAEVVTAAAAWIEENPQVADEKQGSPEDTCTQAQFA